MRAQEHLIDIFPFNIKNNGITVYPKQIPFSLVGNNISEEGFKK